MAQAYSYNPQLVSAWFGPVRLNDWADGQALIVKRNKPVYVQKVGTDGETILVQSRNRTGTVRYKSLPAGESNDLLTAQLLAQIATGRAVFPFILKDNNGRSLAGAPKCMLMAFPQMGFGAQPSNRDWVFEVERLLIYPGSIRRVGRDPFVPPAIPFQGF